MKACRSGDHSKKQATVRSKTCADANLPEWRREDSVRPSEEKNQQESSWNTPKCQNTKLPNRWNNCPKQGDIVKGIFLPFKTPLDDRYASKLTPSELFTPEMVLESHKNEIGLWIDLTQADRYYDRRIVIARDGVQYMKLKINGHQGLPPRKETTIFVQTCARFHLKSPNSLIAVHCTHGFNRTGFMICAFLIEQLDLPVETALSLFAESRPPGIYKQHYVRQLFEWYGDVNDTPEAPKKPNWGSRDAN